MPRILFFALPLVLGTGLALSAAASPLTYTAIDLGTLGGASTAARDINDAGQVTGFSDLAGNSTHHAFITGRNGQGMTDLGSLRGYSEGYGINNSGQVAGRDNLHAFITGPNGRGMTDLGALGNTFSDAWAINNAGQVTGRVHTLYGSRAFITGPNGEGMRDLGTLGRDYSAGYGINDRGQVTGETDTTIGSQNHAFITGPDGQGMRDLGTLGGEFSIGSGINNAGVVVGYSFLKDGSIHAFITGPDGMDMRDLGTLGGRNSTASGVNNLGQVVGLSFISDPAPGTDPRHAFVTGRDGKGMLDLNVLIDLPGDVTLIEASAINNRGQIITEGSDHHAYLLTPFAIPEPETDALILTSLGLMGLVAWWRKKRSAPAIQDTYSPA